ncbi:unnamed protein product [Durusdinium trenchii]|uniref:Transmembrane protein n=1 Tax=Durusdinium trenchii TaxID=1381693 RepID=A0ABP0HQS5_9DINO
MSASHTLRELRTEVDAELLRGVPLEVCLSGWAKHFVPPDPGMFQVDHRNYELSRQTEHYDEFLSHDWQTSRWYKLASMLIVYNSKAAFVATLFVSLLVGILLAMKLLPMELWIQLSVSAVFWIFLCFWQRIKRLCGLRTAMVFLDKLCIAQHDEELKQKGIFGLAGFLDQSQQLTILWSHRYFSRLWCTYEVGTFLRDPKRTRPILVMPVKLAVLLMVFSSVEHLIIQGYYFNVEINQQYSNNLNELVEFWFYFIPFVLPSMPLLYYIGLTMFADLKALPEQLRQFRVQDAKCFCCSHNHRHPDTQEVIPCDRELMFQMLKKWFGQQTDQGEEHLELFNRLVHEELAPRVLGRVGSDVVPLNYSIYMVFVAILPGLTTLIPALVDGEPFNAPTRVLPTVPSTPLTRAVWSMRIMMEWSMNGQCGLLAHRWGSRGRALSVFLLRLDVVSQLHPRILVLFWVRVSMRLWLIAVEYDRLPRVFASCILAFPVFGVLTCQWFSFHLVMSNTDPYSWTGLLPAIPWALWLVILYCTWSMGSFMRTPAAPATPATPATPAIFKEEMGDDGSDEVVMQVDDELSSTFST